MDFNFLSSYNINSFPEVSPLVGNNYHLIDPFCQEEDDEDSFFDKYSPISRKAEKENEDLYPNPQALKEAIIPEKEKENSEEKDKENPEESLEISPKISGIIQSNLLDESDIKLDLDFEDPIKLNIKKTSSTTEKTKNGKTDFYLPIGEKEKRCDRFETKPVYKYDDMIIYSPSVLDYLKNYWENSLFEFRMPYEIGMRNTKETLVNWKRVYEKKIVYDLKDVFTQSGFVTRTNFELQSINKEKYPQSLGDYDVFAINACKKEIWIVECKVIEKVETFYEMYRQQNRFFNEDKEDEKFQRRIDYLREHYSEVLSDLKISAEKYEIKPFMCVNKVFVSRYKEVAFPILSYQELVKEIKREPTSI